jgi:signal transduction histidine kinase
VLSRRLHFRLLAPTVAVSLVVVTACAAGLVYLSYLNVHVASDLSENVQSTQVAARLETATVKLLAQLRLRPPRPDSFLEQVDEQNREAAMLLGEAGDLANLAREQLLVGKIRDGFHRYLARWRVRAARADIVDEADNELADLLERTVLLPCRELRHFNTDQIEQSDRSNRAVVDKLRWGLLAIGLGLPLAGLILGYAAARGLRHSIYQLSVRIRDAAGRLSRDLGSVTVEEEGDLPDLHRQMQGITDEIERVVGELQQREREVLRAEQLAAVGQVAAGVAHELRNPLTSVKMLVQTALEGTSAPGLSADDLVIIEHEIRRMEQCIRLFLEFARPPQSERRRADLTQVIRRALMLVEGRAKRQKVTTRAALPATPVFMHIDPEQIHQVLLNLLLNALDAMPRGGTVTVGIERLVSNGATSYRPGAAPPWEVEVRVRDSGPGIAPRILERLFQPFVSSKETGLGLGLSICKRLIEAHGGAIRGENGHDGGAVFIFTLPEAEQLVTSVPVSA